VRCFYNHHQRLAFKPLVCLSAASNINKTHGGRYGNIERCKSKYPSQESTHITLTLLAPSSDPGSPFVKASLLSLRDQLKLSTALSLVSFFWRSKRKKLANGEML
jgi:hypothetical protein